MAILERPVPVRQGIGNVHEKVTTSSPRAQTFYDQGVNYLYGYDWIEAVRSFNQALRVDPNLAMAYVRLSELYTQLKDNRTARIACNKAQLLSDKASQRERTRIQIRADQLDFMEDPDSQQKYVVWRTAIGDALKASPTDWGLWVVQGAAIGDGAVEGLADFETALVFSPQNSGVQHLLAHTFENLGQPQQALAHAVAFARLAPSIAHAHHMVGHELRRLGRTGEAIGEYRKADELERSYYRTENIPGKYDWHYAHNLALLAMCYQALGQMKAAEPFLKEAFSLPAYTDTAEYYRRAWPDFLLARGRPEESLQAAQQLVETSTWPTGRLAGHEAAGRALLALNRSDEARNELELAEREMEHLPAPRLSSDLSGAGILRGEVLLHDQKQAEADAVLAKVEGGLRAMPGPDTWSEALFPLEFIAQVAREYGDWHLAEFTARQMIEHDPSYAGGYYAMGLAAEHGGDRVSARRQFQMAAKLWGGADPDLHQLVQLREKLAP